MTRRNLSKEIEVMNNQPDDRKSLDRNPDPSLGRRLDILPEELEGNLGSSNPMILINQR